MDILHHHHRGIDQDAEIDRPDRQQIGRGVLQIETDEREQQRQRDGRRDDQPGAEIVEEEHQYHDDQQHAAQQIARHRVHRHVDQVAAVVERHDLDVLGQDVIVEFLRLRLDPLEHVLCLLAGAQQDDAFDRVILLADAELAQPRRDADDDMADILDQHRRALVHRQHDIADILDGRQPPEPADIIELPALRIETAAAIAVVGGQRAFDLLHRQAQGGDAHLIEHHLILHRAAAEAGIVRHAGHRAVMRLDRPFLDGLQFHRRAIGALQRVAIDQARGRGQRRDRRRDAARQVDIADPVERLLARRLAVGAIGEIDHHVGQAVERDRTHDRRLGNAVHAELDRHGDLPLDFLGGMAGPLRDDLDHRRREIGIGIDRQALQ